MRVDTPITHVHQVRRTRYSVGVVVLLATLAFGTASLAFGPDGTPDVTFGGGDGVVTWGVSPAEYDAAEAIALLPNGKMIAVGQAYRGGADGVYVARLNVDGSADPTFGVGQPALAGTGILWFDPSAHADKAEAVAIQPDGRIIVVGSVSDGTKNGLLVMRFLKNGALDPSFSGDGVLIEYDTTSVMLNSVVVLPAGTILVAGRRSVGTSGDVIMVRYKKDGSRDSAFGFGTGQVVLDRSGNVVSNVGLTLHGSGKLLVSMTYLDGATLTGQVVRLGANGAVDSSFGSGGVASIPAPSGYPYTLAYAIKVQPDGKIVVAGGATDNLVASVGSLAVPAGGGAPPTPMLVARFTPAGVVDTSFNGTGVASPVLGTTAEARAIGFQSDGKLLVGGYDGFGTLVARFTPVGALDLSFGGGDGISGGLEGSGARSLVVHPNGRVTAHVQTGFDVGVVRLDARSLLPKGTKLAPRTLLGPSATTIPAGARVTMSVKGNSRKICQVSGGKLKGVKVGTCVVTVSVKPKKSKAVPKPATTKTTFTLTVS